jgi:hypothetical protein
MGMAQKRKKKKRQGRWAWHKKKADNAISGNKQPAVYYYEEGKLY